MIDNKEKLLSPKDKMMRRSVKIENNLTWNLHPDVKEAP
jgi:hypothetical protein